MALAVENSVSGETEFSMAEGIKDLNPYRVVSRIRTIETIDAVLFFLFIQAVYFLKSNGKPRDQQIHLKAPSLLLHWSSFFKIGV